MTVWIKDISGKTKSGIPAASYYKRFWDHVEFISRPGAMASVVVSASASANVNGTTGKVEKPCKQCQRKNFIDASKCWWCETPSPAG